MSAIIEALLGTMLEDKHRGENFLDVVVISLRCIIYYIVHDIVLTNEIIIHKES